MPKGGSKMIWAKSTICLNNVCRGKWSKPEWSCVVHVIVILCFFRKCYKCWTQCCSVCWRGERRHLPTSQPNHRSYKSVPDLLLRSLLGPHAWINTNRREITRTSVIKPANRTDRHRAVRQRERHVDTGSHILLFISTSEWRHVHAHIRPPLNGFLTKALGSAND